MISLPQTIVFLAVVLLGILSGGCTWLNTSSSDDGNPADDSATSQNVRSSFDEEVASDFSNVHQGRKPASFNQKANAVKIKKSQSIAEWMLFQPTKFPDGFRRLVVEGQQVKFASEDGTQLDAHFFHAVKPRHVVLFCHGNGGNLSYRTKRMQELQKKHQVTILLFDYRGYGRSEGKPTVSGILADGRAALRKAAELGRVETSDVVVMGRSLGGAVATQLAREFNTKGLIIESTFSSFRDIAKHHTRGTLQFLVGKSELNTVEAIKEYRGPVLVSHSVDDQVVPFRLGKAVFESANQPKSFYEFADRGHNDEHPNRYQAILAEFFSTLDN